LPTAGKVLTDAPKYITALQVRYENENFFAQAQGKYTGKRFGSLTNDESVPSFVTVDLLAGYNIPKSWTGPVSARVIASVTNLLDKKYYGGVNFGNNALSYNGIAPNLPSYQVGASRFTSVKLKVDY
jgi:iron complex outermembrane receptor protein